jgi:hypothetical protein
MWKRFIIPLLFCIAFVGASCEFWYLLKGFYETPFIWTRFNNDFNFSIIPLGINLVVLIFFSSLLTLVKPRSTHVYAVYVFAALTMFVFLKLTILTGLAAIVYAIGFAFYEWSTNKLFHSYIKIDFWDTYTKTIPTLITFLTVVISLGHFQASIDHLNQLKITIPKILIEKAFESVSPGTNVKGAHTNYIAQNTDSPEVNDLINKQLEQFGITDPSQQELYREQIKQQLGVAPLTTEPLSATQSPALTTQEELLKQLTPQTSSSKQATSSSFINKLNSIPGLAQIQENYKDQLVNQMKNQLEEQVNGLVNKYAMYIPVLNAIAVFFLLSILNLPVMLLCIGLVVIVMDTLKFLKVIDVVKVKMEVERFAW